MSLSFIDRPHTVLAGPHDVGTEQRWHLRFDDGSEAVLSQLAPDLARDESIRRRYVRDVERVQSLGSHAVVETLAIGPQPDPRSPNDVPPWRLRISPNAKDFTTIIARAPVPFDEFSTLFAALADAVHAVHTQGAVLRDLRPEQVLSTQDGRVVLCDIGLARVDVLSSHTASSLLLQGSPYAAPEQLFRTTVDQRSDLYSLGAMMWHALTGVLPFDDGPALLRERPPLPDLRAVRSDAPEALASLMRSLLEADPAQRPPSVTEISWVLRGGTALQRAEASVTCQHCGDPLRMGQRLCLSCGKVAVRFEHGPKGRGHGLDLLSLREDAAPLKWLKDFLRDVSRHPMRPPEFIIGNIHLYDDDEKIGRIRLPARLYSNLTLETAQELAELMRAQGLKVGIVSPSAATRAALQLLGGAVGITALGFALSIVGTYAPLAIIPLIVLWLWMAARFNNRLSERRTPGVFNLREAAVALPASDPFVARLSALLQTKPPQDVRNIVSDLALLVQRLVDHRAGLPGARVAEVDMLTEPLEPLVDAVERHVQQLIALSDELRELDEGAMVRALAVSEARGDSPQERDPLFAGLDRLRKLEDQRAAVFHRLLEVQVLLQRTVEMGLAVQDAAALHERNVQLALAALE